MSLSSLIYAEAVDTHSVSCTALRAMTRSEEEHYLTIGDSSDIYESNAREQTSRHLRLINTRRNPKIAVFLFLLRLGVTLKSVTLGNVTMSHRTREGRCLASLPLNYDRSAARLEN
ncbi:hypothetical protein EVAR_8551_1 [Eumeta japonica]|uniref:Uncharacterized protein n=1 Tax=Eumeta variegata TaxID=151549 RepID=A0A4C1TXY8_EUMVA|nr:hypothetical protein EVAR_8551_1 [Eumeta japonica]